MHAIASSVQSATARVQARAVTRDRRGASVVALAAKKSPGKASKDEEDEAKIDFKGLKQLISMGLGTMSGDITEINLKDPKRTVVMELGA